MVERLASIRGAIAWLAAAVLFAVGALLRALADILDEFRRQAAVWTTVDAAESRPHEATGRSV